MYRDGGKHRREGHKVKVAVKEQHGHDEETLRHDQEASLQQWSRDPVSCRPQRRYVAYH